MTRNGQRLLMLIDDEPAQRRLVAALAARRGWRAVFANDGEMAIAMLGTQDGMQLDAILLDHWAPEADATALITEIRERRPALPLLMLTANGSVAHAVAAMRAGATDFLVKPLAPERLLSALEAAVAGKAAGELRPLTEKIPALLAFDEIVGSAPDFRAALAIAAKAARARVPVLLEGESGVGKEVVAEAIHAASPRGKKPMVAVNCGAIPANLIQSELFGHEKGAFTGAAQRKIGSIETANGGDLFLDEIGDLPLSQQVNLLRVLQERSISRLGSTQVIPVDFRIIAATNIDLQKAVENGHFREDLYYRLNVVHLNLPPLCHRAGDVQLLGEAIFRRFSAAHNHCRTTGFSIQALRAMNAYHWPGNVRELMNRVHRAIILSDNKLISAADLGLDAFKEEPQNETLENARATLDRTIVENCLRANANNVSKAARQLGVSRVTLYRMMNKHNVAVVH